MQVARSGSVSILALAGVYWLAVVAAYLIRGRLQSRAAVPDPDGRVVFAGHLNITRAVAVLVGPPAAVWLLLWVATR